MCGLSSVPFSHYPFHFVYSILTCITTFELPYGSAFMKINGALNRKKVQKVMWSVSNYFLGILRLLLLFLVRETLMFCVQ
jgi:hypothetical protein